MCLILFAWQTHPDYPLVIAANRDEFHARPTQPAHHWPDTDPIIIAGRDLQAGGTWMGMTANGRFAAVTNYREIPAAESELSRGELVTGFLQRDIDPADYARRIQSEASRYAGFNLLVGDRQAVWHISNRADEIACIGSGVHGLSNATLNTAWPKVTDGKSQLQQVLSGSPDHQQLQSILADEQTAQDDALPNTGVKRELERVLSARKIVTPSYGTRSSTTVLVSRIGRVDFYEQRYNAQGQPDGHTQLQL